MGVTCRFDYEWVVGLRVGRFDFGLNTAAVIYRMGSTLVDTGPANCWPAVRTFLQGNRLKKVLLTHHHEDHSGNAARIHRETEAAVYAPPAALSPLAKGWPMAAYQRIIWGRPEPVAALALPAGIDLDGAGRLVPVATPGHAEDLVCYHEPEQGWLFTGDLFIGSRPRYLRFDEDLDRHMSSLREILALDFRVVFCGHRGVVVEGRKVLRDKLDYLENLRAEARELGSRGWSLRRITRRLLGREDLTSFATGYTFTKRNLVAACLKEDPETG